MQTDDLVLQASADAGEEYDVYLSWNDISNEDEYFQYRLYRKCGDGEWEPRSTWNGEEKVKVLNIYPALDAGSFLTDWIEEPLEKEDEPAGRGLFEIDTVYIDDYNSTPEKYLMDEKGNYKYDVLVFGSYDYNGFKDLSSQSYEATDAFSKTGRGILFGHDTVTSLFGHAYFS